MEQLASLGIDPQKVVLYLVNIGGLLLILHYFLYKPMFKYIDQRRKTIADSIEESQKLREEFQKKLDEAEAAKQAVEADLRGELQKLQKFTDQKRTELVAEMETARSEMMSKAQAEIDAKKAALIKDAEKDLQKIMVRIILDIVENKVPENVVNDSIKSAWKHYSK